MWLLLWLISAGLGELSLLPPFRTGSSQSLVMTFMLSGLLFGALLGLLQRWIMRRVLGWFVRNWVLRSSVGAAGAFVLAGVLLSVAMPDERLATTGFFLPAWFLPTTYLCIVLCVSLLQSAELAHSSFSAALWIVANLVGGLVFIVLAGADARPVSLILAATAQSLIGGAILYSLFQQSYEAFQREINRPI